MNTVRACFQKASILRSKPVALGETLSSLNSFANGAVHGAFLQKKGKINTRVVAAARGPGTSPRLATVWNIQPSNYWNSRRGNLIPAYSQSLERANNFNSEESIYGAGGGVSQTKIFQSTGAQNFVKCSNSKILEEHGLTIKKTAVFPIPCVQRGRFLK
ncbi:UNVERIFIED_CONTAM: hypothetical protein K2H54_017838 [Gekko kuhli]